MLAACGAALTETVPTPTATVVPDITVCAEGCDFTSIQAAIDAATVAPGAVIGVQDAVHTEAGILIHKPVTIQGQGADRTIVQAHAVLDEATDRVFSVARGITVTLRAMTIRHGNPRVSPEAGGGILNEGSLLIEDSVITANSGSAGGGIHSDGTLTLINCTVSENIARGGGDSFYECSTGGGIKDIEGTTTLLNTAVIHNSAEGKGGGIHVACKGILTLTNSTVSGNSTNDDGGGIYLDGIGHLIHTTISANIAKTGGGIYVDGSPEHNVIRGQLNYTNTLIAGNAARMEKYGVVDCKLGDHSSINANSYNFVGDESCAPAFSGDPLLAPLASDEGHSSTHALLPNSPAIDAVPLEYCVLTTDQWGLPRTDACDIGAFEVQDQ